MPSTAPGSVAPPDRIESIPLGERWLPDAFSTISSPGGFALRIVDMTKAKAAIQILRDAKIPATYTMLIVRAAALALARNPELHQSFVNYRRLTPGQVDIGLSMAGETSYAPVVVLPAADRKPIGALVPFAQQAIAAARIKEKVDLANMRRFMWVIPFGFLRRFLIRLMNGSILFRRKLVGTFQVSCLPSVDVVAPFLFYTGSLLGAGSVKDRVLAVDGQPVVRPTVRLTVCIDHAAMDGRRAGDLLGALQTILEGDELLREATEWVHVSGASLPDVASSEDSRASLPSASSAARVRTT